MPTAVVAMVVGSVVSTAVGTATTALIGTIAGAVVSGAVSAAFADKPGGGDQQPGRIEQEVANRLLTVKQPVAPWQWIYGQTRVGGTLTYMAEVSETGVLHLVITLAGHECEELGDIWFDDEVVPLDGSGNATGTYAGYCTITKSRGNEAAGAQPFAALVTATAGLGASAWTSAHCQTGRAKLYVALTFNQDLFPSGIPNITCVVKGRKVFDPRNSPGSTVWSENAALCINDYVTNAIGLGATYATEVDEAQLIAAANICDETVTLVGSPTVTEPRYTLNGSFHVNSTTRDILSRLNTAMAGPVRFISGKWAPYPAAYPTPTVTLTQDDLRAGVKITPRLSKRDLCNAVKGIYVSPGNNYQPSDFPVVTNATYYAEDQNERIWRELDLPFTDSAATAQRIAKLELERVRQQIVVSWPGKLTCYQLKPGDTCMVTLARYGWSAKVFEVVSVSLGFDDDGQGGVALGADLLLRETAAAVYTWTAASDETTVDLAPDSNLPDPLAGLGSLSLGTPASGTAQLYVAGDGTVVPRVRCTITPPTSPYVERYELQFAPSAGSPQDWQNAPEVRFPDTVAYFYPVRDGVAYDLRARAINVLGVAGAWAYQRNHTVIGKTEVPSDVTGASAVQTGGTVVMGCNEVTDSDLDAVEVRYQDSGNTNWTSASPVANILRGQTITSAALPPGTWELLFKARDTSGNYSNNAARVTITVTSSGFSSVATSNQQAPKWLGEKVNLVHHWTGVLYPDTPTLASAMTDAQLWDTFVYNPYATCYYTAPEIDKGIDATARIYADIISALGPDQVGIASPEFDVDYKLSTSSYDGFEIWSVGSVNFRYLLARFKLDTTIGVPYISGFNPQIDAVSRQETGTYTTPAGGSVAVAFTTPFHTTPVLVVTPQGSGDVSASYTALGATGFTGYFKTAGAAGAGTASYNATGA